MSVWLVNGKIDFLSLSEAELTTLCEKKGWPAFRARQLVKRQNRFPQSFDEFSELPKELRAVLDKEYAIPTLTMARKQKSKDGTVKYLFTLWDGQQVESVFMRYRHGNSLCISTQVGCRMGCAFCASGLDGLVRNLAPSEMLLQAVMAGRDTGLRVDSIVMMGTGEPLDNFDASVRFVKMAGREDGLSIGQRSISLSTSGLCDKIAKLSEFNLGITLSISLHSPFDEVRSKLMPVNRRWSVGEVVDVATKYQQKTKRRISYEYAMIDRMTDRSEDAFALAALLKGKGAHLNLIRLNKIAESPLKPSAPEREEAFVRQLNELGLHVTVRRSLGRDIDGACGQLRRRNRKASETNNWGSVE
jgi:23S rRNA (adenine2503-C2)-methyltransferase